MIFEITEMTKEEKIKNILTKTIIEAKSETFIANNNPSKTTKKDILENNKNKKYKPESVKIVGEGLARVLSFDGKTKRQHSIKEDIMKWNNADLAFYVSGLYFGRYGEKWIATNINITMYMANIKESLQKMMGFSDNIILKDYFYFFFEGSSWSDDYRKKGKGNLFLKSLKEAAPIEAFANRYDYKSSLNKYLEQMKQKEIKTINESDMKKSYLLGLEKFVIEYGIVLVANWMIKKENMQIKEAIIDIAKSVYNVCMREGFEEIKNNTEYFSPYPKWLILKEISLILDAVNKKMNKDYAMNVLFSDEDNKDFEFLK